MIDQNPYAVTASEPSRDNARYAIGQRSTQAKICWFLVCLSVPLLVIGTALAFLDIETIVGSGPIMFGFGVALVFLTRPAVLPDFRWLAWVCLFFPIGIFLLIFLLSWHPAEAQTPISILIAVMTAICEVGLAFSIGAHRQKVAAEEFQQRAAAAPPVSPPDEGARSASGNSANPPANPLVVSPDDDQSASSWQW